MNKREIIRQIIEQLDAELLRSTKAAKAAQEGSTDEQSRAENKYDTRGLEASYLAHGQSRKALETIQAREQFSAMPVRDFTPEEPAGAGALIELDLEGERLWYLLGPAAGGTVVEHEGREVLVLTAQSPLGVAILDRRRGDRVQMGAGKSRLSYLVTAVS